LNPKVISNNNAKTTEVPPSETQLHRPDMSVLNSYIWHWISSNNN